MKITRRKLRELVLETSEESDSGLLDELVGLEWLPYGSGGNLAYIAFQDARDLDRLPALGITPQEALSRFQNRFNIKTLNTYVFGDIGQHRYSDRGPMGLERHPTGRLMFPPAWTLAAHALIQRSQVLREKFEDALVNEDREGLIDIAIESGFGRGRGDEELKGAARLMDVLDDVSSLEEIGGLT